MLRITQYQRNLKHYYAYYTGGIDGIIGAKTRRAVRNFQRDHDLIVDGIYGKNTESRLTACIKELQRNLNRYGKYELGIDGVIGDKTIGAIKDFQQYVGLSADGIAGKNTFKAMGTSPAASSDKVDWSKVKYFTKSEFKCSCHNRYCNGYPAEMSPNLIYILEELRKYFGKPVIITSGLRCAKENVQAGGIPNSAHKVGNAADIYIKGASKAQIKSKAYSLGAAYSYYGTAGMGEAVHINV